MGVTSSSTSLLGLGEPLTVLLLNVGQLGERERAADSACTMAANKDKALPTFEEKLPKEGLVFDTIVCRQVARFVFLATRRAAAPLSHGCSENSIATGADGPTHRC